MGVPKRPTHIPQHRRPPQLGRKRRVVRPVLIVIGVLAVVAAGVGMALALYFEKHRAVANVDPSKAHTGQWQAARAHPS